MSEEINTISEEQVLHNELSFEINQELIHLMKRIVEIQQENQQLKEQVDNCISNEMKQLKDKIEKLEDELFLYEQLR